LGCGGDRLGVVHALNDITTHSRRLQHFGSIFLAHGANLSGAISFKQAEKSSRGSPHLGKSFKLRLTLYSHNHCHPLYISAEVCARAAATFDDWTRQGSVRSLSTNAGADELPFQLATLQRSVCARTCRQGCCWSPTHQSMHRPMAFRSRCDDACRAHPMPKVAVRLLRHPPCCFPHASPVTQTGAGKRRKAPEDHSKQLTAFRKIGAGEGIRTLDPNLGKVVLYP
jgi:hypothetical protein